MHAPGFLLFFHQLYSLEYQSNRDNLIMRRTCPEEIYEPQEKIFLGCIRFFVREKYQHKKLKEREET